MRHRLPGTIRHTRSSRSPAIALCLLVASPALPQADDTDARARLDAFNASVHSFTATFTQETWSVDNRLVDEASGVFALERPGRFVWHTLTPYELLVVADGQSIWMYDVELEQVTRSDLDQSSAANPGMLLSGDRAVDEDYRIGGTYQLEEREFVELLPKDPAAEFSRVLVAFAGPVPDAIEVVDGLNQTTRIEFADVEVNPDIEPSRFEFVPPPDVNVIGGKR